MSAPAPATTRYVRDEEHYAEVLLRAREAKKTLWIGTADLKDVFVMQVLEGADTADVCRELEITEANCWVRLHRARKRLSERMSAHLT